MAELADSTLGIGGRIRLVVGVPEGNTSGRNAPESFRVEWNPQSDTLWYARVSLPEGPLAVAVEGYEGDEWIARAPEGARIPSAIGRSRDDALAKLLARRGGREAAPSQGKAKRPRLEHQLAVMPKRGGPPLEGLNPDALRDLYRALDGLVALVSVPEMFGAAFYCHDPSRTVAPLVAAAESALEQARQPKPPPVSNREKGPDKNPTVVDGPRPKPLPKPVPAKETGKRKGPAAKTVLEAVVVPAAAPNLPAPQPAAPLFKAVVRRSGEVIAEGISLEACGELAMTYGGASFELRREGAGWRAWSWSGSAKGKWFKTALTSDASNEAEARKAILERAAGHPGWDALAFEKST